MRDSLLFFSSLLLLRWGYGFGYGRVRDRWMDRVEKGLRTAFFTLSLKPPFGRERRLGEAVDMDLVLEAALKSVRKGKLYRRLRVFLHWSTVVGVSNAGMARPVSLRGGTLVVKTEDPAWADRLKYMEDDILHRIAEMIGEGHVRRLRFVTGELDAPTKKPVRPAPLAARKLRRIDDWLAAPELAGKQALKDDLKKLFVGLMAREESIPNSEKLGNREEKPDKP